MTRQLEFGMGKGKIYPHQRSRALLNPLRRLLQHPAKAIAPLGLAPGERVLEVGPGPGLFSIELARAVSPANLCLFDIQHEMLAKARPRLAANGLPGSAGVQGDALVLPFRDGSFDAVFMAAVLGEVPDPPACLRELRRVLRPGGRLAIGETRGDPDRIPYGRLAEMAAAAGFADARKAGRGWSYTAVFTAPR